MRLHEFLKEDISVGAALKTIIDIFTTELPVLYRKLAVTAEAHARNFDPMKAEKNGMTFDKSLNFIIGSQRGNWYSEVFTRQLKPALYHLSRSLPKNYAVELKNFLDQSIEGGGFKLMEGMLFPVLKKIATATKNTKLGDAVTSAESAANQYHATASKLKKVAYGDYYDVDEPEQAPQEPNPVGQQNATIEGIINDTLSRIDRRQAGEIRNILARSGNKLATLQQELNRRGIEL